MTGDPLHFAQCWICYPDDTERYASKGGPLGPRHKAAIPHDNERKWREAKAEASLRAVLQERDDWKEKLYKLNDIYADECRRHTRCFDRAKAAEAERDRIVVAFDRAWAERVANELAEVPEGHNLVQRMARILEEHLEAILHAAQEPR